MAGSIDLSWAWAIGLIAFAFGIVCGIGIGYRGLGNGKRTRELQERLDTQQQEFNGYRSQVGQHFLKTSELVQKMTDSYREVYEHLASGSQSLCQEPVKTPRLDIPVHPNLDSTAEKGVSDEQPQGDFSDAETNELKDADSDAFLGDSPHVPTLDTQDPENRTTPHIPSP